MKDKEFYMEMEGAGITSFAEATEPITNKEPNTSANFFIKISPL